MNSDDTGIPRWLAGIGGEHGPRLIQSDARVIKVLAGPGAGKTTCLEKRVMRLVDTKVARRSDVFIGTFTRVIAKALRDAFGNHEQPADSNDGDPTVLTLHSLASRLLRENPAATHGRGFRFLLAHEEKALLSDIATKVTQFPTLREREKELKKLHAHWASPRTLEDARFSGAVDGWLRFHGAMLIGEVVFLTTSAIHGGDIKLARFKHVIVDEYQDLTECEQTFVDQITSDDGSIVVLGDDDQSIYGFRFNHPDGIRSFPSDGPRKGMVESINLPSNYRCGKAIVALANGIAAEGGSLKPPMEAALAYDGTVSFISWDSLDDEIAGIAEVIRAKTDRVLVLVPRQFIGYRLKALLGDDAATTFHEEVLGVDFVRERFCLAALLANPNDMVAVRGWLALMGGDSKQPTHRNAAAYSSAIASGQMGLALLTGVADGSINVSGIGTDNVRARAVLFLKHRAAQPEGLADGVDFLFDPQLADEIPDRRVPANESPAEKANRVRLQDEDRDKARGDLDLLRRSSHQFIEREKEPTMVDLVDDLRYRIGTRAPLLDDERVPRVRIMTLHGAKGLEEETVFVLGLADEIVPGPIVPNPSEEATRVLEQRRLLYVAVTRAKRDLVLSWSRSIASADTRLNGIARNNFAPSRSGIRQTVLTRTRFFDAVRVRPAEGADWVKSEATPS